MIFRTKTFIVLTFAVFYTLLHFKVDAQPQKGIDSMEQLLSRQKDTTLASSYNELTKRLMKLDRVKSKNYNEKALELSHRLGYIRGEGLAYYYEGVLYLYQQDLANSLQSLFKSTTLRKKLNDRNGLARTYLKIGTVYQLQGKIDSCLSFAQEGLKLFKDIHDEAGTGDALMLVGTANEYFGNIDVALNYYQQCLDIRLRANDMEVLPQTYSNIGNCYFWKKEYAKAKTYYKQADSLATINDDYSTISLAAHNLAVISEETGDYKSGLDYAETAFSIRQQMGQTLSMVRTLNTWGSLLIKVHEYKAAEEKLLISLKTADTLQGGMPEKQHIYRSLTSLYEATGDYKKAIKMAQLVVVYNDSVYVQDMNTRLSEMEVKYQAAIKDQQIREQQFAITKKNILIGATILLSLLLFLLAFNYYRRFKLKKERQLQAEIIHQQDIASKGIIEAEERERKRIAGDLHDGLGQLFSAVKMNMNIIGSNIQFNDAATEQSFSNTLALVDESCKEVRSISHQMMPNTLLKYGLVSAVRDFIQNIDTRQLKVNLEVFGLNERLDSNTETVLYRVLQETVNNVIKHSGASQLDIQLSKEEDSVTATIEDNGKGFNMAEIEARDGIGLKNIRTRIEYLKGTVEFDATPGRGTVVSVWVPISKR